MKYILTNHARKRMEERAISSKLIKSCLDNPTKLSKDKSNHFLFKKLYNKNGGQRLLMVVAEKKEKLKVITIIDTTKIKKYL